MENIFTWAMVWKIGKVLLLFMMFLFLLGVSLLFTKVIESKANEEDE